MQATHSETVQQALTEAKAFLFDLNGTMVADMDYHINAWRTILNSLGANLTYEQMKGECYGKNSELLERIFPSRYDDAAKQKFSQEKEAAYREGFQPQLRLLEGLDNFLAAAHTKGIKMAIGSAAIRPNVDFVLDGLNLRQYFSAIVSAEDVQLSKPHPETFLNCAEALGVEPSACIVFEDAPKGVESAAAAGMKCVVLTTMHIAEEFAAYSNVITCVADYQPLLSSLSVSNAV